MADKEMNKTDSLRQQISAAMGEKKAELVLKNAKIVNVFTHEIEAGDIAVEQGKIVGIGAYEGAQEIDLGGKYVCPGFMDAHIHLESAMVSPEEFQRIALPHGTTAVFADPHEIANVAGVQGIEYMLEATENLALDVYFMLPSCVPSTDLDEAGAILDGETLLPFYKNPRVKGLAELMNAYGTVHGDGEVLQKVVQAWENGGKIDGHAPFLTGKELNAYALAGARSDHECSVCSEAKEKMARGQWIMIREGTAAKNMEALAELFAWPYCQRVMLATDDKHPGDILALGHVDYLLRRAVALGADPIMAVAAATLNTALYFGCAGKGAVAPGYDADLVVVEDLKDFRVHSVYKAGKLAAAEGKILCASKEKIKRDKYPRIYQSFHMDKVEAKDFALSEQGESIRVIQLVPNQLITEERLEPWLENEGAAPGVDVQRDIIKIAVFERHQGTGHKGLGFLGGYGLKSGAVATSVGHDSHNLVVAGTTDEDMAAAANAVIAAGGGLSIAENGKAVEVLPLPIGGLMSEESAEAVEAQLVAMKKRLKEKGIAENIDPFMTLAFVSLPVIPKLRINTLGVVDVDNHAIVRAVFSL